MTHPLANLIARLRAAPLPDDVTISCGWGLHCNGHDSMGLGLHHDETRCFKTFSSYGPRSAEQHVARLTDAVDAWLAVADSLFHVGAPLCLRCYEDHERLTLATHEDGDPECDDCRDDRAERNYESSCTEYYGGSHPLTLSEQMADARRFK